MTITLADLAEIAVKTIIPAVIIGFIGHWFLALWQHRYWRIRKTTDLQDETYRRARDLLVRLAYTPESLLLASFETTQRDRERDSSCDSTGVGSRLLEDRMALAELSSDVSRLFRKECFFAVMDAVKSLLALLDYIPALRERGTTLAELMSDQRFGTAKMEAIANVKWALSLLASEIGRNPPRPGSDMPRRRGDIPTEYNDILLDPVPADPKRRRRHMERLRSDLGRHAAQVNEGAEEEDRR